MFIDTVMPHCTTASSFQSIFLHDQASELASRLRSQLHPPVQRCRRNRRNRLEEQTHDRLAHFSPFFFFFFRDTDERDYKLHLFSSRPFGKTHLESLLAHLFKARTTYWGKMSKYYGTRKQMSLFLHGFLSGKKKKGKPASRERGTVAVPDDDAKRNTKPCIVVVS